MYIIVISDVESQCQTRRYIPDPSLKGETTNIGYRYANTFTVMTPIVVLTGVIIFISGAPVAIWNFE
jgi:hypothetical protein